MILLIAVESGSIFKDSVEYTGLAWLGTPDGIKQLQWDGSYGVLLNTNDTFTEITELPDWALNAIAAWEIANVDRVEAKNYSKLVALKNMTPAQVQAWCAANITNLAQAKDAITTLAVAVSVLARRL
jgi:hypothetical protein